MHPLGGRELYRVAWLILGLASGCLLTPRYVYFPRFFSIAFFFLLLLLLHVSRNSRTRRFPIFYLFFRKKKIVKLGFFEKKTFIFVPLAFEKRKFSRFSFAFAVSSLGSCLLFLTFPFFRDHPSLLAWRPLEPRRVAADS